MKKGDKVRFLGTRMFWFTDVIDNGNKLSKGAVYTVSEVREFSSWTSLKLEETGDMEYNHVWFEIV
jgi:hypothetical protein